MKVFVIGATGVLGRHVLPRLVERGHTVRAVVRRPEQAERLSRQGVEPFLGDILDPETLPAPLAGCDAALHLATAIPTRNPRPEDWARNDAIRRDGTRNLLDAATAAGVRRYVQQSITFLYGEQGDQPADETTPLRPSARIQSAVDMEARVRESTLDWCILRGGAFYGPHTSAERDWRDGIQNGTLRLPGDGAGLISLIQAVDMARAVVMAAEGAPAGSVYNVVDDQPVTYGELFGHLAALLGVPSPAPGGPEAGFAGLRSLGCRNGRLKAELGWAPAFPTYRAGLA